MIQSFANDLLNQTIGFDNEVFHLINSLLKQLDFYVPIPLQEVEVVLVNDHCELLIDVLDDGEALLLSFHDIFLTVM